MDTNSGRVTSEPDIISRGFVYMKESGPLLDKVKMLVKESLRLKKGRILDWHFIRKNVEEQVASFLRKETGREPLIVPVIVEV